MAPTKKTESNTPEVSVPVVVTDKEKLQQQLRETILQIDKKLSQLEGGKKVGKDSTAVPATIYWENNAPLGVPQGGAALALHSDVNLLSLISYHSKITRAKYDYEESAESLGLKSYPDHTWNGFSSKQIISFLEMRISVVANSHLISQLKAEKKKLETFLSEEDRLAATLQSLSSLLTK